MIRPLRRCLLLFALLCIALTAAPLPAAPQAGVAALKIDGLGKGSAPLDGPWQFHLGDNPAWAQPQVNDATGSDGWEQLSADKSWGEQGHPSYTGYAWYRRHIQLTLAPGAPPDLALFMQRIDDVYEIYWNGVLVGRNGVMPPHASVPYRAPVQTFGLGPVRDGVLAVRVWKGPLLSFDPDTLGGFNRAPVIGSPEAIAALKAQNDYGWLRSRQFDFGLISLYGLVMLLSLMAWVRDRSQKILFWMAVFCGSPVIITFLVGMRLPFSFVTAVGLMQPVLSAEDIALWFLLLYLLKLDESPTLSHLTRLLAVISICSTTLDGLLVVVWNNPQLSAWLQPTDAVLTTIFTVAEAYPLLLVALGVRKKLDSARWLVVIFAFLTEMISVLIIALQQGSRFTHWTIGEKLGAPLFTLNGNAFTARTISSSLLLLAIIYAVYRYVRDTSRRQSQLEQEFKSARELQQVLIPEEIPPIPGFALTSAYRPAQEVGGDFFQIIPLEGQTSGSTLIILGDVSGKGLKAAMTVSLIVGAARTIARFTQQPAEILTELNVRLFGRMQGGFVTCLALRLDSGGHCVVSSAGHPAPFLNDRELSLPGALPLGILSAAAYEECALELREGDHFALYTDGLLEARRSDGEIFSFQRLEALLSARPDATRATEAAVEFGQDDDITVLTFTRLGSGQQPSTAISVPGFA